MARRNRPPLTVRVVHQPGAPLREEDWTPEQEEDAIRALARVMGRLIEVDLTPVTTDEPEIPEAA